jgi:galactonate dehydratase
VKIGQVTTFLVSDPGAPRTCLFVKLETDDGLVGWGECATFADRDLVVEQHVKSMAPYICGRDPFAIKHFCLVMFQDFANQRGGMDFLSALSGVEHALWDIVGKACGHPVYNLLGGPCRDRIRVYANGWAERASPAEVGRQAAEAVGRGFRALKWDPFPRPRRRLVSHQEERLAVENVRAVREAVGPAVDLLIEGHRRLAPTHALRFAKALEELDAFWYEEPVTTENLDNVAMIRDRTSVPIVGGEDLYTKSEFRVLFEKQAADIINPDVMLVGGILALKEIAAMAEPYDVSVSPHGFGASVGFAATVQACAVMPNYLITDYYVPLESLAQAMLRTPFVVQDSYVDLPTGPGLGVEVDEAVLRDLPYRPQAQRRLRQYADEGP